MCFAAVDGCMEQDLKDLGLALGDIIKLKSFCSSKIEQRKNEEKIAEKKALLESILQNNRSKRKANAGSTSSQVDVPPEKKKKGSATTRKVHVGWMHFMENSYKSIRQANGGGTRDLALPLNANKKEVIDAAKQYFFPNGKSQFGNEEDMHFSLANFKKEEIPSDNIDVNGTQLPFTISSYANATKLPRLKLYLTSKPLVEGNSAVKELVEDDEEIDDEITFKHQDGNPSETDALTECSLSLFELGEVDPTPPVQLLEEDSR